MSADIPTGEEFMAQLRMALTEAGWPDTKLVSIGTYKGWPTIGHDRSDGTPTAVFYQAMAVVDKSPLPIACWACYSTNHGHAIDCIQGRCRHPEGPARPPKELLVPKRDS